MSDTVQHPLPLLPRDHLTLRDDYGPDRAAGGWTPTAAAGTHESFGSTAGRMAAGGRALIDPTARGLHAHASGLTHAVRCMGLGANSSAAAEAKALAGIIY